MSKLKRAGNIEDLPDIDNLTSREIKDKVNQFTFDIQDLDEPLYKQIEQFENKLMTDNMKLNKFKEMKQGKQVIVTMADEIQSDILQQAKRFEEKLRKQLGELIDLSASDRLKRIKTAGYNKEYRDVDPEVAEFFLKNKTVFRPLFQNETEMQIFINKFNDNKKIFEQLAGAGPRPDKQLIQKAREAEAIEQKMLFELETAISENAMKQLHPNLPFKNRSRMGRSFS